MSRVHKLTLAVLASCIGLMLVAVVISAQPASPTLRVGDVVALEMDGELAREYAQEIGGRPHSSAPILVPCRVDQLLGSGAYRISHIGKSTYPNGSTQIVDVSADVSPDGLVPANGGSADGNGGVVFVPGAKYQVRITDVNHVTISAREREG